MSISKNRNLNQVYQNLLNRDIGDEGKAYWGEQLASGNQTLDQIKENIKLSDEYFLNQSYKDLLGRPIGQEGLEYWGEQLASGKQTRDQVIENIKLSNEYQSLSQAYKELLGRDVDSVQNHVDPYPESSGKATTAMGVNDPQRSKKPISELVDQYTNEVETNNKSDHGMPESLNEKQNTNTALEFLKEQTQSSPEPTGDKSNVTPVVKEVVEGQTNPNSPTAARPYRTPHTDPVRQIFDGDRGQRNPKSPTFVRPGRIVTTDPERKPFGGDRGMSTAATVSASTIAEALRKQNVQKAAQAKAEAAFTERSEKAKARRESQRDPSPSPLTGDARRKAYEGIRVGRNITQPSFNRTNQSQQTSNQDMRTRLQAGRAGIAADRARIKADRDRLTRQFQARRTNILRNL